MRSGKTICNASFFSIFNANHWTGFYMIGTSFHERGKPVFSSIKTELQILSLYRKIWLDKNRIPEYFTQCKHQCILFRPKIFYIFYLILYRRGLKEAKKKERRNFYFMWKNGHLEISASASRHRHRHRYSNINIVFYTV